jgi:hypothetical protein
MHAAQPGHGLTDATCPIRPVFITAQFHPFHLHRATQAAQIRLDQTVVPLAAVFANGVNVDAIIHAIKHASITALLLPFLLLQVTQHVVILPARIVALHAALSTTGLTDASCKIRHVSITAQFLLHLETQHALILLAQITALHVAVFAHGVNADASTNATRPVLLIAQYHPPFHPHLATRAARILPAQTIALRAAQSAHGVHAGASTNATRLALLTAQYHLPFHLHLATHRAVIPLVQTIAPHAAQSAHGVNADSSTHATRPAFLTAP